MSYTPMEELTRLCAMMPPEPQEPVHKGRKYSADDCPNHRWRPYTALRYRCPECRATEKRYVVDDLERAA